MNTDGPDFIATELLKELRIENERKDQQIKQLHKIFTRLFAGTLVAILLCATGFIVYLNQYDFSTTETHTADGYYAIVDGNNNALGGETDGYSNID